MDLICTTNVKFMRDIQYYANRFLRTKDNVHLEKIFEAYKNVDINCFILLSYIRESHIFLKCN